MASCPAPRMRPREHVPAQIFTRGDRAATCPFEVINISQGGICLRGPDPLEAGRSVELTIWPDVGPIALSGEVVWSRSIGPGTSLFQMGCSCKALGSSSRERLGRFLSALPVDAGRGRRAST